MLPTWSGEGPIMPPVISMGEKIQQLRERFEKVRLGGGTSLIERQHAAGKLTARERVRTLCDEGSFTELGALVEHQCTDFGMEGREAPADGVVTGYGRVDGRLVFVYAQDFTVIGGSVGMAHAEKICKVIEMALEVGAPLIGLNDSAGARIQEGVDSLSGYGQIFYRNVAASGTVPQITAIMGPCAGGAVYSPALTDFVIVVNGTGYMFVTGPDVTRAATGREVTMEELGGADVHTKVSGVADFLVENDEECLQTIKRLLSYLPSNSQESPPQTPSNDDPDLVDDEIERLIPTNPRRAYDMRHVITRVVDGGEFFEVKRRFAPNILTGFTRLDGMAVGMVANQPRFLAGCLDIDASDKAARFIRFCDAFNIPLISLVDVPGFLPGVQQEHGGIIRHGAKMLYAYSEATVPKITLIMRKAYGGAYLAMCSRDLQADVVFALPTAEIAVMGPEGAVEFIYRRELASQECAEEARRRRIEEYREKFANPYRAAARGYVDAVIEPREIRPRFIGALRMLAGKRRMRGEVCGKHSNMPM